MRTAVNPPWIARNRPKPASWGGREVVGNDGRQKKSMKSSKAGGQGVHQHPLSPLGFLPGGSISNNFPTIQRLPAFAKTFSTTAPYSQSTVQIKNEIALPRADCRSACGLSADQRGASLISLRLAGTSSGADPSSHPRSGRPLVAAGRRRKTDLQAVPTARAPPKDKINRAR